METFYKERAEIMRKLRLEQHWTMQMIADQFGISRERVRQIIGNTGYGYNHKRDFALEHLELTNCELAEKLQISSATACLWRRGLRHAADFVVGSSLYKGKQWEEWAQNKLVNFGFVAELMPLMKKFDILIRPDIRIDVKAASISWVPPNMAKRISSKNIWRFSLRRSKKRGDCDFYMCIITPTEDIFIIPANEIPLAQNYIVITWPLKRKNVNTPWAKYRNRFDLIEQHRKTKVIHEEENG